MAASATSPRTDWFKFTVEVTLKILDFLSSIIQFLSWHVVKPIICWIYTWLNDSLRHNYTPYKGEGMVQGKFKCHNYTPYQGEGMVQGKFKCQNCRNRWSSGQSWANMGQKCRNCLTMVYPYDQRPLQPMTDRIDAEEKKPHLPEFCERCETLGYNCRKARKIA